jgi:ABC-2 type transport system permease protein
MSPLQTWKTLVRREFWESRSLWIAPLAASGVIVLGSVFMLLRFGELRLNTGAPRLPGSMPDFNGEKAFAMSVFAFAALIFLAGGVAIWSYLMDSLYGERRDRSILFWKSLPVSDTKTVLSKLLVALVIAPAIMYGIAIVTHLICGLLLALHPPQGLNAAQFWNPTGMLKAYVWLVGVMVVNALWFAPAAAYAMLASVISRKSPWVTMFLPLLLLSLGEQLLAGSNNLTRFVLLRFAPRLDLQATLASPGLWIGVAVAAAGIVGVIRLRRWRDDS